MMNYLPALGDYNHLIQAAGLSGRVPRGEERSPSLGLFTYCPYPQGRVPRGGVYPSPWPNPLFTTCVPWGGVPRGGDESFPLT